MDKDKEKKALIPKAFDWALSVDAKANNDYINGLKKKYPKASREQLIKRIIRRTRWWGVGAGVFSGLAANPFVAVPAAVADVGAMLRIEIVMATRIALLYDPKFLDDSEPPYELLVPIFGINAVGKALKGLGILGGMGFAKAAIKKFLAKDNLKQFKKVMLKYFGLKVAQKGVIGKALPIIGGVIGGGWNFAEMTAVGHRVVSHFENKPIKVEE